MRNYPKHIDKRPARSISLAFLCALCKERHFAGECSVRIASVTIYGDPRGR